jgi:hypothetical protein
MRNRLFRVACPQVILTSGSEFLSKCPYKAQVVEYGTPGRSSTLPTTASGTCRRDALFGPEKESRRIGSGPTNHAPSDRVPIAISRELRRGQSRLAQIDPQECCPRLDATLSHRPQRHRARTTTRRILPFANGFSDRVPLTASDKSKRIKKSLS